MADGYYIASNQLNTTEYVYTFCQQLSAIATNPCPGAYLAAENVGYIGPCIAHSGSAYTDISVATIAPQNVTLLNGTIATMLSGVQLSYGGGEICPLTGTPNQFLINLFCDPNT